MPNHFPQNSGKMGHTLKNEQIDISPGGRELFYEEKKSL
jgi:hypothetical protein